jgi:hypothetical protein
MIKAIPFIQTIGTEKFKEFLLQPFKTEQLDSNDNTQILFDDWKFTDDDVYENKNGVTLNFFSTYYVITKGSNTNPNTQHFIPMPVMIEDFVNDMAKYGVSLFWSDLIDEKFEPKDYLHKDEIRNYFQTLLNKMGKYNELK